MKYSGDLRGIMEYLENHGIVSVIIGEKEGYPVDSLIVSMSVEGSERNHELAVNTAYVSDEDFNMAILQFYAELPFVAQRAKLRDMCMLLGSLNAALPIGHYEIINSQICFKHVVLGDIEEFLEGEALFESLRSFTVMLNESFDEIQAIL